MNGRKNEDWLKEYEEFLDSGTEGVPSELTEIVSTKIEALIDPSPWRVFAKVLGIHAVVGSLSLGICHQFNVNPFRTSFSLADWLMAVGGHSICMIGCGILFVGLSVMASGYFLSLEESRALRRTGFPQSFALSLISLIIFVTAGADMALTFAALWLLGALIGGFVAAETVWQVKAFRLYRIQRS